MPIEKSAGAIIFRKNGQIKYLLLHYPSRARTPNKDYWDFPKGHIEKGESLLQTVKREIKEETGIGDIKIASGFKETIRYFFRKGNKNILKFVTFFLAESKTSQVKISPEHIGFNWLSYNDALKRLTFKIAKEILEKAHRFLSENKAQFQDDENSRRKQKGPARLPNA